MTTIVTHDGAFHADDVVGVAIATMVYTDATITRTRNESIIANADIVIDVGGVFDPMRFRFDHHQPQGAGMRANGIPYASAGLVWQSFGERLCATSEDAAYIDANVCAPLDAIDNGVDLVAPLILNVLPISLHYLLSLFAPTWQESQSFDDAFGNLVSVARTCLERAIVHANALREAGDIVRAARQRMIHPHILILPQRVPWEDHVSGMPELLFVIAPRPDGSFGVRAVPVKGGSFKVKVPFPVSWAGLVDAQLQKVTGVSDARFCHRNRFLAVAQSEAGAFSLARLALPG